MGILSLGTLSSKHCPVKTQHSTVNMSKEWNHGTFSCCDDMGTCCFSYWCGCCQIYNTAEELGKSGCLYLLMSCFITPCVPIMLLRTEARKRYDIQGDQGNDALCACCCGFCTLVQTVQEVKEHKG